MPGELLMNLQMDKPRVLYPKFIILIVLGFIFYFGIWINLKLLKIAAKTRTNIMIFALAAICMLIFIELLITNNKIKKDSYKFYNNRVEYKKRFIISAT